MLCGQYLSKSEGKELKILVQPETQHRARYLTEGSRGSVKDRTQQGFPTVKVCQKGLRVALPSDLTGVSESGLVRFLRMKVVTRTAVQSSGLW